MSLPLNPAPLFSENEYDNNELKKKGDREKEKNREHIPNRNRTIKNNQRTNNIESMIQSLHNSTDDSGNDKLSDFNPLPNPPQSAGVQRAIDKSNDQMQTNKQSQTQPNYNSQLQLYTNMLNQNKNPINSNNIEAFSKQNTTGSNVSEYHKQYQIPTYYNQMSENIGGNKELLDKLNYMIHLLEEQKDESTGHVTEEIILYTFLGVFMIFIIDSFARVGKYVR
jgi:hypothetical protein